MVQVGRQTMMHTWFNFALSVKERTLCTSVTRVSERFERMPYDAVPCISSWKNHLFCPKIIS